jgi:hypothetical protein
MTAIVVLSSVDLTVRVIFVWPSLRPTISSYLLLSDET